MPSSKLYKIIGFGTMDVTKPYKFTGFGDIQGPKPYEFKFWGPVWRLKLFGKRPKTDDRGARSWVHP